MATTFSAYGHRWLAVQSKKVIALIVSIGFCCAAEWVRVRGDGYEIATDAGGATARRMAVRLEGMRELLGGVKKSVPLRVVLLRDRNLYSKFRPSANAPGFFQAYGIEDWVVVDWGTADAERVASHELVHAFLEHSGPRRPMWLEEGLAEFYSTARLTNGYWYVGEPIPSHQAMLRREPELGIELFRAEPEHGDARFYARSWAVVHYLLTAKGVQQHAPRLFALLGDGAGLETAVRDALGLTLDELLGRTRLMQASALRVGTDLREGAPPPATVMLEAETEELLVNLALATGKPELARHLARTPAQKGLLALADGDKAGAQRLLAEAAPDARVTFELATLTNDERLLERTIALHPDHAEARHMLGIRASLRGESQKAIVHLRHAASLRPRSASILHSLALELEKVGRLEEARRAAQQCSLAARNAVEREMAAGLERLTARASEVEYPKKPPVLTPKSWQGLTGDTIVEGVLVDFDCGSMPPIARVESAGVKLELRVARPNEIRVTGGRHEFSCGPQRLPVKAGYIESTRELTAIEFR